MLEENAALNLKEHCTKVRAPHNYGWNYLQQNLTFVLQ